jgi:Zn-dependent alcohol dehydrogenase
VPFRSQPYVVRCNECDAGAATACPQCRAPICVAHAYAPHGYCEQCATEMYFAVSRAGKRHVLTGSAIAFVSTIGFYTLNALRIFPPVAAALLVLGVATGIGAVLWGGSISPRLTERAMLRRQLKPRRLLSLPDRAP